MPKPLALLLSLDHLFFPEFFFLRISDIDFLPIKNLDLKILFGDLGSNFSRFQTKTASIEAYDGLKFAPTIGANIVICLVY